MIQIEINAEVRYANKNPEYSYDHQKIKMACTGFATRQWNVESM